MNKEYIDELLYERARKLSLHHTTQSAKYDKKNWAVRVIYNEPKTNLTVSSDFTLDSDSYSYIGKFAPGLYEQDYLEIEKVELIPYIFTRIYINALD